MKALFTKTLAVLLSAMLLFTAVPFAASAAATAEQQVGASSGTTGSCTWTLDDNSKLTISGNGAMRNYDYDSSPPWGRSIKSVVIEDSVTTIGSYAFEYCTGLTSVTIPDSVTSIGEEAFRGCTGLTSITIPDSVTSIGGSAFSSCTGLKSVTIPDSVTSIGSYAFDNCTGLKGVYITDIAAWCNIKFDSNSSNPLYYAQNLYLNNQLVTDLVIPDSVTSIGSWAFSRCTGLSSVAIPDSVTSIGGYAFSRCTGLSSVTIPDSVTSIEHLAFHDCTGLTSVTIPDSVTSIGGSAFYNTAWYNNQPDGLVYAGKVAYVYKGTMPDNTSIVLKDGTKGIAGSAFEDCTGLTGITIPDSVTSIGSEAFSDCTGLTSVTIPDSVTSIGNSAFWGCTGLTSVTIGNSVTSIGSYAFLECTGLTSVTIPNSVTSIGEMAFDNCGEGLTIYGYSGSAAEEYAKNNNIKFESIGKAPDKTGDMDGDGVINGKDAAVLARYTSGWDGYADKVNLDAADINGDGKVNGQDSAILMRYTSGWEGYARFFN